MKPELILHDMMIKRALTLSVAESCAGGLISNLITDIPGSSSYFRGAVVAYSNEAKVGLLKVPKKFIEKDGAVSERTAAAMARGARRIFSSDLALSVTGIAGPSGGSPAKPVGIAYIAVSSRNGVKARKVNFSGSRLALKRRFAEAALKMLVEALES